MRHGTTENHGPSLAEVSHQARRLRHHRSRLELHAPVPRTQHPGSALNYSDSGKLAALLCYDAGELRQAKVVPKHRCHALAAVTGEPVSAIPKWRLSPNPARARQFHGAQDARRN